MNRVSLQHRVTLSYILFVTLIFLDVFAVISTIAPTIHTFFNNINSTEVATNATTTEANVKAMEEESMQVKRVAMLVAELFGLTILMLSNVTGIQALRRAEAYLLVPWLFVYIIGICR